MSLNPKVDINGSHIEQNGNLNFLRMINKDYYYDI